MKSVWFFVALFVGILGVWLVYWPIMESIYACSLMPLFAKMFSFLVGVVIIAADSYFGVKVLF